MIARSLVLLLACAFAPVAASAQVVAVTTCGQVVTGDAVLVADLDCSLYADGPAITIDQGTLDLAGFRVIGNPDNEGVYCTEQKLCEILGPGEITGAKRGIRANRLKLFSVTVRGNLDYGVLMYWTSFAGIRAKLTVSGGTFADNTGHGIYSQYCSVADTDIANNGGIGLKCLKKLAIKRSNVSGNVAGGIFAGGGDRNPSGRISETMVSQNGEYGVNVGEAARITDSTISGNFGDGVRGYIDRAKVSGTVIVNNERAGWRNHGNLQFQSVINKTTFKDSTIEGNCTSQPAEPWCGDLYVCGTEPKLVDTACGTSVTCGPSFGYVTMGLCALD